MEDLVIGSAWRGRRVLVTGHTGFKGAWLCHWLLGLGAEVAGLALAPATKPNLCTLLGLARRLARHDLVDIRDAAATARAVAEFRPQVVLHLAAQALVREAYRDPKGTFDVNVGGTVSVLEAVRACPEVRACVVVTSDKCYDNREWPWGYRESDPLGGHDPYSASKGAAEIAVASWRRSFFAAPGACRVASARAGNVIGGGDWAKDRIVTDFIATMERGEPLRLRNPRATRPWQHVLEPLSAYLALAGALLRDDGAAWAEAWNFGPRDDGQATVETLARALVDEAARTGAPRVAIESAPAADQPHEAGTLKLDCSKARARLAWHGVWDLATTARQTVAWYREVARDPAAAAAVTDRQIAQYTSDARAGGLAWARA